MGGGGEQPNNIQAMDAASSEEEQRVGLSHVGERVDVKDRAAEECL